MRSLKDCEWEVKVDKSEEIYPYEFAYTYQYRFQATTTTFTLIGKSFRLKQQAKRNWERFAKINSIKSWKYV